MFREQEFSSVVQRYLLMFAWSSSDCVSPLGDKEVLERFRCFRPMGSLASWALRAETPVGTHTHTQTHTLTHTHTQTHTQELSVCSCVATRGRTASPLRLVESSQYKGYYGVIPLLQSRASIRPMQKHRRPISTCLPVTLNSSTAWERQASCARRTRVTSVT